MNNNITNNMSNNKNNKNNNTNIKLKPIKEINPINTIESVSINKVDNKVDNKVKNQLDKDNYKRPELTYTDKLSKAQIKELLVDYEKINNLHELEKVPSGTHIRYFEMKNDELKFRTGGILTVVTGLPDYIILNNNKISWSVQVKQCIFFKRITIKQVRDEYNKLLYENDAIIKGQQKLLTEQSSKIKELTKKIKELTKK